MHTPGVVVTCGVMGRDTAWYVDGGGLNDENIVVCNSVHGIDNISSSYYGYFSINT